MRDGKIDPSAFLAVSLDEAAVLRGFGGTKTFREFMRILAGDDNTGKRTEASGTVSCHGNAEANQYIELLAYAAFLGMSDVRRKRASSSATVRRPTSSPSIPQREARVLVLDQLVEPSSRSGLRPCHSDEGCVLPPIGCTGTKWPLTTRGAGAEGWSDTAPAQCCHRRAGRGARSAIAWSARREDGRDCGRFCRASTSSCGMTCGDERRAIKAAIPESSEVYGSLDLDEREQRSLTFPRGARASSRRSRN